MNALLADRAHAAAARHHAERGHSGNDLPAAQAERHSMQSIFVGHVVRASFQFAIAARLTALKSSFGEHRREIFPFVEKGRRQIIRLAFDDRAQRALLIDAQIRRRRRAFAEPASLPACRRASA